MAVSERLASMTMSSGDGKWRVHATSRVAEVHTSTRVDISVAHASRHQRDGSPRGRDTDRAHHTHRGAENGRATRVNHRRPRGAPHRDGPFEGSHDGHRVRARHAAASAGRYV